MTPLKKLRELASRMISVEQTDQVLYAKLWYDFEFYLSPQTVIQLLDRLKSAEDALRFYGTKENWETCNMSYGGFGETQINQKDWTCVKGAYGTFDKIGGKQAREHLKKWSDTDDT